MYTNDQIWNSFATELAIIKHLAEKIPEGTHGHKPTEKQRTTLELLQYLSAMGMGFFNAILEGDANAFRKYSDEAKNVTAENFSSAIDREEAEMRRLFAQFTEEKLAEEVTLFGQTQPRSLFVLSALKMMTAYKMQLFLYAKSSGNHTIGTSNLWAGMDAPTPTA